VPKQTVSVTTDDRLDVIITYLRRMDRRDKWRTVGGFFRGLVSLIPIILLLWGTYYLYENSDEILTKITQETVKQTQSMTNTEDIMKQLEKYMPKR
jgi:hypothetical protein